MGDRGETATGEGRNVTGLAKFNRWEIGEKLQLSKCQLMCTLDQLLKFNRWEIGEKLQHRRSHCSYGHSLTDGRSGRNCNYSQLCGTSSHEV